ncbi:hypothetical protein QU577_26995 [Priestia megaterium]|uniref:hypothetical protein n=1 Tax=Priestia megaterium TaxID=1404 RepID=UPI0025B05A6A|nr:hypothetical protein [Priestia megaterium]MDN3365414.1 hypothetical protein [Priestia megaterium]
MDSIRNVLNKHLGRVIIVRTRDKQEYVIRLSQVDYYHYQLTGYDVEGMKLIISMKQIVWIKEKRSSSLAAKEDPQSKN